MIQETEKKQRLARMVGIINSDQFMSLTLGQDVHVLIQTFIKKPGGSQR